MTGTRDQDVAAARALLPIVDTATLRRALWGLIHPHRGRVAASVLLTVVATTVALVTPWVLGRIVDLVLTGSPPGAMTWPVVLIVLAETFHGLVYAVGQTQLVIAGQSALATLREQVVARALRLDLEQVEAAGTGDLVSRISGDVTSVSDAIGSVVGSVVTAAITVVLTIAAMAAVDTRIALAALLAVPLQVVALRQYLRDAGPIHAAARVAAAERTQQLLSTIGGALTVRLLGLGRRHLDLVARRSIDAMERQLTAIRVRTRFFALLNMAELAGTVATLVVGFVLVRRGDLTVGQATAGVLYFIRLFDPIGAVLTLFDQFQAAGAGLARLIGVATAPEPAVTAHAGPPAGADVQVDGVGFAYGSGPEVVEGIQLLIGEGERVALVGASGAGKTTLAKLVAGVHRPGRGEVRVGGVPVTALEPSALRRAVALVTQDVHVFAGSLADDLRLVRPDATDGELLDALDRVGATGWVRDLPSGLATTVGDGGRRLTATQAQQLALARLVLADPAIVILDEATAEAGSAGAKVLEAAALRALEGRTAIVVAHRLTQAATADRIVVMDRGRVREAGTHEQLVSAGGIYAALWRAWSGARGGHG